VIHGREPLVRLRRAEKYAGRDRRKTQQGINAAIADPGMKAKLAAIGGDPMPGAPAAFGRLIADETEKWGKVVRAAGSSRSKGWLRLAHGPALHRDPIVWGTRNI